MNSRKIKARRVNRTRAQTQYVYTCLVIYTSNNKRVDLRRHSSRDDVNVYICHVNVDVASFNAFCGNSRLIGHRTHACIFCCTCKLHVYENLLFLWFPFVVISNFFIFYDIRLYRNLKLFQGKTMNRNKPHE